MGVGSWLTRERALMGMETRFHGLCMCFSGNFGVRKYIAM